MAHGVAGVHRRWIETAPAPDIDRRPTDGSRTDATDSAGRTTSSPTRARGVAGSALPPNLPDLVDDLQRSVGNRAVQRLLARDRRAPTKAGASSALQRILDPSQVDAWKDADGDAVIAETKAAISQWEAFRANPAGFEATNAIKSPRKLVTLLEQHPEFKNHVAQELRAGITYLQEMAGFIMPYRLLIDLVPGVTWKDPKHTYTMTAAGSAGVNGIGYLPVQEWDIKYSNAYGWKWTHSIHTAGIQWAISISTQSGVAGPNIGDIAKGKGEVGKKLTPGKSTSHTGEAGSNPLMPEFAEFNIRESCIAKPVKYWGFDDVGGVMSITNGPSVSGKLSIAGSVQATTGGMMRIDGSNGDIEFTEFTAGIATQPTGSVKDAINMEFKATLASVGIGAAIPTGKASDVSAPKVVPTAREQERSWGYVLQEFPIGETTRSVPEGLLAAMHLDAKQMQELYEADLDALRELGKNPEKFRLRFLVEGYASRVWTGAAGDDQKRLAENQRLSAGRAWWMSSVLQSSFGTDHFWEEPVGRGSALYAKQGEGGPSRGDVVAEGDTAALDAMVEKYRQRQLAIDPKIDPAELDKRCKEYRASVEKSNPKDGWGPAAQRVNITMSWKGFLVDYGMAGDPAAPAPAAK